MATSLTCETLALTEIALEKGWLSPNVAESVRGLLESDPDPNRCSAEWLLQQKIVDKQLLGQLRSIFEEESRSFTVFPTDGDWRPRLSIAQTRADISDKTPKRIGPYLIHRELGKGAMGVVYLATDLEIDAPVALKVLPDHVAANERSQRQLHKEAKNAALLRDDNHFVHVYRTGILDGKAFVAMEYVQGSTLSDWMVEEANDPDYTQRVVHICRHISMALAYAHDRGLVHRDIKPANVMITSSFEIKILDFGVSKKSISPFESIDSAVAGTPLYMTPEILEMSLGKCSLDSVLAESPSVDIYAFGVMCVELFTLDNPFRGRTFHEILTKKKDENFLDKVCEIAARSAPVSHHIRSSLSVAPELRPSAQRLVGLWTDVASGEFNSRPKAVLRGPQKMEFELYGQHILGSSPDSDFIITSSELAPSQLIFRAMDQYLIVENLAPNVPFKVNESLAERATVLEIGDTISVANLTFEICDYLPDATNAKSNLNSKWAEPEVLEASVAMTSGEVTTRKTPTRNLDEAITLNSAVTSVKVANPKPLSPADTAVSGKYYDPDIPLNGEGSTFFSQEELLSQYSSIPHLLISEPGLQKSIIELETHTTGDSFCEVWSIGTNEDCDIRLNDNLVLPRHAELMHSDNRWRLINLVAPIVMRVDGEMSQKTFIEDGDVFFLGSSWFVFKRGQVDLESQARPKGSDLKSGNVLDILAARLSGIARLVMSSKKPADSKNYRVLSKTAGWIAKNTQNDIESSRPSNGNS